MSKHIYIFSGLGADESVFQLLDFSGFSISFIQWIIPNKGETIENYATRLIAGQITTKRPTLIGLSFGGLIAVEAAKQLETGKVILIASAKTKKEIPFYYRWTGRLRFHKLLPASLLKQSNFISNWFFGAITSFDKQLLKTIFRNTDPVFLKWAIDKALRWTNQTELENVKHIHGTADRILPFCFIKCDLEVKNGGHFMTINKAGELTRTIRAIL